MSRVGATVHWMPKQGAGKEPISFVRAVPIRRTQWRKIGRWTRRGIGAAVWLTSVPSKRGRGVIRFLTTADALFVFALLAAGFDQTSAAAEVPMPARSFNIDSGMHGKTRHINVYAPPGYEAATTTPYPAPYMPDGGLQEDFPHPATGVDAAIRGSRMRPMIVIGIENTERRRDMAGAPNGRELPHWSAIDRRDGDLLRQIIGVATRARVDPSAARYAFLRRIEPYAHL